MKRLLLLTLSFAFIATSQAATLGSSNFEVTKFNITKSGKRKYKYYRYDKAPKSIQRIAGKVANNDRVIFNKVSFKINKDFSKLSVEKLRSLTTFRRILNLTSLKQEEDLIVGMKPLILGKVMTFKYKQALLGSNTGDDLISDSTKKILNELNSINNLGQGHIALIQNYSYFSNIFKKGVTLFNFYPGKVGETIVVSYGVLVVKASTAEKKVTGRFISGGINSKLNDEFTNLKRKARLIFN